jgi:hypothetical protein
MAADRPLMIDGFSSVQAARRAAPRRAASASKSRPVRSAAKAGAKSDGAADHKREAGSHIGRTALPPRHEIRCYACGYGFVLTGRLPVAVLCPKCRESLETGERVLEQMCSGDVRTVGTVSVVKGAVADDSLRVVAGCLRVAGDLRRARVECRELEMDCGGKLDLERTVFRKATVCAKARYSFDRVFACQALEVQGSLTAKIQAAECVAVRRGGCVRGEVVTPRLTMEEGARLSARLVIGVKDQRK